MHFGFFTAPWVCRGGGAYDGFHKSCAGFHSSGRLGSLCLRLECEIAKAAPELSKTMRVRCTPLLLPLLFLLLARGAHAAEEYPEAFTEGLPMWIYFAIGFASVIFLLLGDDEKKDSSSGSAPRGDYSTEINATARTTMDVYAQIRSPIPTGSIATTDASANAATAAATTTTDATAAQGSQQVKSGIPRTGDPAKDNSRKRVAEWLLANTNIHAPNLVKDAASDDDTALASKVACAWLYDKQNKARAFRVPGPFVV